MNSHPYPADPVKVIHVKGDDNAIGRSHAEQVGVSASHGMPRFYYDFWKRMLHHAPSGSFGRAIHRVAVFGVEEVLGRRLKSQIPDDARARLLGISQTTGRPLNELLTAMILPDLLPLLGSYAAQISPRSVIEVAPPPRFGCSSFVARGNDFLVGRNLDFPGVAYWDRYPVLQATERDGYLKFIAFTTAGIPFGGITGINEAQISFSLHQHYCRKGSLRGVPPFLIGEQILGKARTLNDAREILRKVRIAASWAFIVADGKSQEAFICEAYPGGRGFRELSAREPVLAHSNFFVTPECRPLDYATTARMNWDNHARKNRLESLVRNAGSQLRPEQAVQFISEHFDPYWAEEKTINRTISQIYNIQSLVLDPAKMKLYLAEGNAPIQLRQFREWDLSVIFAGGSGETGHTYPAYAFKSESKRLAKEAYILSFIASFDGNDDLAQTELDRSLKLDFSAEAAQVAGLLAMKHREWDRALEWFERGIEWIEKKLAGTGKKPPPEYFELNLYLARVHDLKQERSKALSLYQKVAEDEALEDAHVRRLAEDAGPYVEARLSRILIPYSSYIPFD